MDNDNMYKESEKKEKFIVISAFWVYLFLLLLILNVLFVVKNFTKFNILSVDSTLKNMLLYAC